MALSMAPAWADGGHGTLAEPAGRHADSREVMRHHGSTTDFLVNLVNHAGELGLATDQVATLKAIQLDLDLTRIKAEAGIMLTEREISGMIVDEKVDLSEIEAKITQSQAMEAGLRVSAVKALRQAMAVLTPSQREKLGRLSPRLKREGMRS
jgi:Spy/CpxP family protein refolding chaperone